MSDNGDVVLRCEEIQATLAAAEMHLRVLAASHFTYAVAARIQRRSALRARELLAGVDLEPAALLTPRPEPLEAVARTIPAAPERVAAPVLVATDDEGPVLDVARPEPAFTPAEESLVDFEDELQLVGGDAPDEEPLDEVSLVSFEEEDEPAHPLVSFDEPEPPLPPEPAEGEEIDVEPTPVTTLGAATASGPIEGTPLVLFDEDEEDTLVQFDPDGPDDALSQIEAAVGGDDPLVQFDDFPDDDDTQEEPEGPVDDPVETFDLMPDLSLDDDDGGTSLEDEEANLVADLDSLLATEEPPPEPIEPDGLVPVDDTPSLSPLSVEDIEFLEPESDVDGEDDPSSTSEVVVGKPPAPGLAKPRKAPTPKPAFRATVPTIRDGTEHRPKAAAVRIDAQGDATMLGGDEDLLEIGDATDYIDEEVEDDPRSGGFQLEEYEDYEVEEVSVDEELPELEPELEPEPIGLTPKQIATAFRKAERARDTGNMADSVALFSDVLDADPDHVEAHIGRGRVYLDLGDFSRAMSDFTVASDLDPESPDPIVATGDLYFARKDYRKAIDYFNEALEVSPDHPMALCRRGISHYYRRAYKSAVDDLTKAEKLDPDIPNIATYVSMAKKKRAKK